MRLALKCDVVGILLGIADDDAPASGRPSRATYVVKSNIQKFDNQKNLYANQHREDREASG